MANTEKILEEFDETFIAVEDSFAPQTHQSYPCFISHFQDECFKDFIAESIHQAIAEERERMRGEIEKNIAEDGECPDGITDYARGMRYGKSIVLALLSSLDKPLTDKEIEEMPQMKGTLEALDKLTIIKE